MSPKIINMYEPFGKQSTLFESSSEDRLSFNRYTNFQHLADAGNLESIDTGHFEGNLTTKKIFSFLNLIREVLLLNFLNFTYFLHII